MALYTKKKHQQIIPDSSALFHFPPKSTVIMLNPYKSQRVYAEIPQMHTDFFNIHILRDFRSEHNFHKANKQK